MSTPKSILVIDLEATCWADDEKFDRGANKSYLSDIIEIGITEVDVKSRQIIKSESILVTPSQSEISKFCTDLTGITDDMILERGIPFAEAIQKMRTDYRTDRNIWASWGKYDDKKFYEQCAREKISYPFNNSHLNIKALFAAKFGFNCSCPKASEFLGIEFTGRWHSGEDDSKNAAKILIDIL